MQIEDIRKLLLEQRERFQDDMVAEQKAFLESLIVIEADVNRLSLYDNIEEVESAVRPQQPHLPLHCPFVLGGVMLRV